MQESQIDVGFDAVSRSTITGSRQDSEPYLNNPARRCARQSPALSCSARVQFSMGSVRAARSRFDRESSDGNRMDANPETSRVEDNVIGMGPKVE